MAEDTTLKNVYDTIKGELKDSSSKFKKNWGVMILVIGVIATVGCVAYFNGFHNGRLQLCQDLGGIGIYGRDYSEASKWVCETPNKVLSRMNRKTQMANSKLIYDIKENQEFIGFDMYMSLTK